MEMCYRGNRYKYNSTTIEVEGKKNEVKFRGQTYQLTGAVINRHSSGNSEVVYRGISVATGEKVTFLGRTYEHRQIVLAPMGC